MMAGDSAYVAAWIDGSFPPPARGAPMDMTRGYFDGTSMDDPIVSPALHGDVIAKFPPTLIITGTLTNCCCESTARDALQMGYKVIFMSDANATLSDEEHLGTLLSMYTIFADVMDTPYLLDLIEKSTATKAAA